MLNKVLNCSASRTLASISSHKPELYSPSSIFSTRSAQTTQDKRHITIGLIIKRMFFSGIDWLDDLGEKRFEKFVDDLATSDEKHKGINNQLILTALQRTRNI